MVASMPVVERNAVQGPEPPAVVAAGWTEPAVIVSTIVAALEALFGVGVVFGLDLDNAQQQAIIGAVAPCVALTLMVGFAIRQMVTPAERAQAKIDQAYYSVPGVHEKPTL